MLRSNNTSADASDHVASEDQDEWDEDVRQNLLSNPEEQEQQVRDKKPLLLRPRSLAAAIARWVKGPMPPRPWRIRPFFPKIQLSPITLRDRIFKTPNQRLCLLIAFCILFIALFIWGFCESAVTPEFAGYGTPEILTCLDRPWADKNGCGLDGYRCRPFSNYTYAFRCPGSCSHTKMLDPHAVGATEVVYRPLVVGGPPNRSRTGVGEAVYRGDSFICGSAIHSGLLKSSNGGCGVIKLVGQEVGFRASSQHGLSSIAFDSYFPLSFSFVEGAAEGECHDLRWSLLPLTVVFTTLISLFTLSPLVFFVSVFTSIFFHVAMISDPPDGLAWDGIVSTAMGSFLPAAFCMAVIYQYVVRRTLYGLTAQFEKTILWVGGCWVGAMDNYIFDRLPLQRLTPHDLQEPGALLTLVIIASTIAIVAVGQAWAIRIEGRLPAFLALYGAMAGTLLVMMTLPHLYLRIHHYILGLLLLPGTGLQTRPSLLFQGFLVGEFINGVGRWGYAAILETSSALFSHGQLGTALPSIAMPIIAGSNITFAWKDIPATFDAVSVLVNDVERFRAYKSADEMHFTWTRKMAGVPEYFRFGYMSRTFVGDYTKAGTWKADGTWIPMESGAS